MGIFLHGQAAEFVCFVILCQICVPEDVEQVKLDTVAPGGHPGFGPLQLLGDIGAGTLGKFSAALSGAAVPVGAGKATIQGKLLDLAAEFLPVVFIERSVHGVPPQPDSS